MGLRGCGAGERVTGSVDWRFSVLGSLEVTAAGRRLAFPAGKLRSLLAVLLVEANAVVSVDRLVDCLWDGEAPQGAHSTVQKYVYRLRSVLEPARLSGTDGGMVLTRPPGYLLAVDPGQIDSVEFVELTSSAARRAAAGDWEASGALLERALGLWRGPAWAEFAECGFARADIIRLEGLRAAAAEELAEVKLSLGRHIEVIGELEEVIVHYPLRERPRAQLILALYRAGRQVEALENYRKFRKDLIDQVGVEPSRVLRRLEEAILAHEPALDLAAPPVTSTPFQPAALAGAPGVPAPSPAAARSRRRRGDARRVRRRWVAVAVAGLALAAGSLTWSTGRGSDHRPVIEPNSVGIISSDGHRLMDQVPVGQSPAGVAVDGDRSAWVANTEAGTVSRVGLRDRRVEQTVQVGRSPTGVAVAGDEVWVANGGDGTVSEINAGSSMVVRTVPVGGRPDAIASGPGGVWVVLRADASLKRLDPTTGRVTMTVAVGPDPAGVAAGAGAVWVTNATDGTVSRVDPVTGSVASPITAGAGPAGIAVGPSAVWVANAFDQSVSRIDPVNRRVIAIISVEDGPTWIAASDSAVWVSSEVAGTITRIDPRTNLVVQSLRIGAAPRGIALVGNQVWVAAGAFTAPSHRGGTLTIAADQPPDPLDPAAAYYTTNWRVLAVVYDGLVGFRRTSGTAGLTLVPDLATSLPRPTDGGRTYTFQLRRGIHYADGRTVTPADIRRGVEREFVAGAGSGNPAYYAGIVGGDACLHRPATCQLSRGVVTDAAAHTVTFRLTRPDPDFLSKLALLFVPATPPGAPSRAFGTHPFPGTGPYMIHDFVPGRSLTLTRNPYFHQWSFAAQPAGYPDIIRWQRADTVHKVRAVTDGTADLADLSEPATPPEILSQLRANYPTRIHDDATGLTFMLALNTRQPPFDNVRARRALAYALDRAAARSQPTQATTCQLLPPNYAGYQPYCPYTLTPGPDNRWNSPDMATARRLVAASHTAGTPVDVWAIDSPEFRDFGVYVTRLLTELGYPATLHTADLDVYFPIVQNSKTHMQVSEAGWGPDFPDPSNYFLPILSCSSFKPDSDNNSNISRYCNPTIDTLAARAQAATPTDPAQARALWTQIDHAVVDDAPVIPTYTGTETTFVSTRVGNYQEDIQLHGPFLDQIWIR